MGVQVTQGQDLDVPEGFVPDVPGHLEGDPVIDLPHEPLADPRRGSAEGNFA